MYKYQNTKTGVIITVESKLSGDWKLLEEAKPIPTVKEETEKKPEKKTKKK